mgnify:CR=1 FL=1
MSREEQWLLCPVCGAKTRLRLLQRTVLREFPLYCPKCRRESVISARNFQIETVYQPDAKRSADHRRSWSALRFLTPEKGGNRET